MLKMKAIINSGQKFVSDHAAAILTGFSVIGMVTTVGLSIKETPIALDLIADAKEQKAKSINPMNRPDSNVIEQDELTVIETIKACWKCYIPAILSGGLTVACIIGSNRVSHKKEVALAAAYKLTENAFNQYKEKAVELIGEEKEKQIQESVNADNMKKASQSITVIGTGDCVFYEAVSGQSFRSSINKVEKARNDANYDMTFGNEYYKSFNEWLDMLGVEHVTYGDEMGFCTDKGMIDTRITPDVDPETMEPIMILDYGCRPVYDYRR